MSQFKCVKCGWSISRDVDKCPKCGTEIPAHERPVTTEGFDDVPLELDMSLEESETRFEDIELEENVVGSLQAGTEHFSQYNESFQFEEANSYTEEQKENTAPVDTNNLVITRSGTSLKVLFIVLVIVGVSAYFYYEKIYLPGQQKKEVVKEETPPKESSKKKSTKKRTKPKAKPQKWSTVSKDEKTPVVDTTPVKVEEAPVVKPKVETATANEKQIKHLLNKLREKRRELEKVENSDMRRIKKRRRKKELQEEMDWLRSKIQKLKSE